MIYIGIDPGKEGGIAWQQQKGETITVKAIKMPDTLRDLHDILNELSQADLLKSCAIEKVAGRYGMSARSAFTFGYQFGIVCTAVVCNRIPMRLISPQRWQKEFGLIMDGNVSRTVKKNRHKKVAQELFPQIEKMTHHIADALLICEWWRLYHQAKTK